jgi:rhomboid protease GluP
MDNFKLKLQHILLPYIIITLGVTFAYLLFYWIVVIKAAANIKANLTDFIIPAVIAAIAHIVWLRPGVKKLVFKNENLYTFYYMIAIGANLWMMIVCANLLTLKTNDIVHLKDITEIESKPKSTFYTIKDFDMPDQYSSSTYTVSRSGKNNKYVDLNLYFTVPIVRKNEKLTVINNHKYWLCEEYHIQKSAHASDAELEKVFNDFAKASELEFHEKKFLAGLNHFEKLKYSDEKIQGIEAIKKSMLGEIPEDIIILTADTSKLTDEADSFTKYIFISFFTGVGIMFLLLIYPKFRAVDSKRRKGKKKEDDLVEILRFLIPRGDHYITSILININALVFVILLFFDVDFMSPTAPQLIAFGGADNILIVNGEPWRLVTSMFLHAGFGHLIYNMIALALVGHLTEPMLGRKRYLFLYIGSGLISGIIVLLLGKTGVSVGASGAIFGLFAAGFTYAVINKIKFLMTLIGIYAGSSLLLGFIIPGTDNIGHLGGVAGGVIIYLIMRNIYPDLQDYEAESPNKTSGKINSI